MPLHHLHPALPPPLLLRLTAVIFSFLKYGFHPTLMTMGQTFPSSSGRRWRAGVLAPDGGTESGGYGAVWAGRLRIVSAVSGLVPTERGTAG
jgi:hypothetical protein